MHTWQLAPAGRVLKSIGKSVCPKDFIWVSRISAC